jgi:hypothetical protein
MSVGKEISSIEPNTPQRSKKEVRFSYDTSEYDSYAKQGFQPPDVFDRTDKWEVQFLTAMDAGKGPVKVRITRMFRCKAVDYSSEKEERKEYLYWESEWKGKNWLGAPIGPVTHTEGKYHEQTKRIELGQVDPKTGIQKSQYVKDMPRLVHSIPFSKKAVDSILNNEHPFGPDSINITDKEKVIYYGKFDQTIDSASFRCAGYTYDQFVTPEWKHFLELATRKGGPAGVGVPNQAEKDKESFIS